MGSMGTLGYGQDSYQVGISKIDDIIPTAEEEVSNGIGLNSTESVGAAVGGNKYEVDLGGNGFNYTLSAGDMATVVVGWAPRGVDTLNDDGGKGGTDGDGSDSSVHVVLTPMDGLTVVAGTGEKVNGNQMDDIETFGATYTYGPVSAGIQVSEIDLAAANSGMNGDSETTYVGLAFNVNENLSISYGEQETEIDGQSLDQELEGFSVGYSMGGISLKAHSNKGTNMGGSASNESEHTEISVSFAF
jgi:hypothetical protein